MESTLQKPAFVAARTTPKTTTIICWSVTAPFCLQLSPQVAEAFSHLGFPNNCRVELSWAKLLGVRRLQATN
jgi:hypothetical protein